MRNFRLNLRLFVAALTVCLCSGLTVFAQDMAAAEPALEGLDPVQLVQGKEVQGNFKITVTRGRFQYMFANEEDKALFEKDPAHYEIQLNGSCARMGAPVGGNPDLYSLHKGRIYIFGSPQCKKLFDATPEKYLEDDGAAKAVEPASAEALKKGRDLIEKAVAAMGTAAVIDGMTDYQEKSISLQTRRDTDVEVKTDLTILFPDRVRLEVVQPDFANPTATRKFAAVLTSTGGFAITPDGPIEMPEANRTVQQRELNRKPLQILRARNAPTFKAAATGSATVADTTVEQVALAIDGVNHTLGIDPSTGRIVSLAYRGRGVGGEIGQIVKVFSDFRPVNGVTLPFKVTATFNGQPWKEQSTTVQSIAINSKVDAALFEKPKVN
jgi:YHS domain-containing protein